ncbi:hypothetical protein GCM10025857_15010 [Alicyclobacillus contaminans]|nr:hypothetical protein GCM10025857_15010 [Alicyclobacillus contaminans]
MKYKVVPVKTSWNHPLRSSNEELLMTALNDHEYREYELHSIVPVLRAGETQEFLVILKKH